MLHATLTKESQHYDHSFHGPIVLKASSRIAAYPPLIVQQAGDGSQFGGYWFNQGQTDTNNQLENLSQLYLVPGTRIDVLLIGGPEQWDEGAKFIETFEILDDKHVQTKDDIDVPIVSGSKGSLYGILCQTVGTFVSLHILLRTYVLYSFLSR